MNVYWQQTVLKKKAHHIIFVDSRLLFTSDALREVNAFKNFARHKNHMHASTDFCRIHCHEDFYLFFSNISDSFTILIFKTGAKQTRFPEYSFIDLVNILSNYNDLTLNYDKKCLWNYEVATNSHLVLTANFKVVVRSPTIVEFEKH